MKVAFIGVGAIGSPMAQRLLPHHEVTVFDVNTAQVDQLVALGATPAATTGQAAAEAEAMVIMVATPAQLRSVLFGADGVESTVRRGTFVIIMSSVGIEAVTAAADRLTPLGVTVVDAPVTGGVVRAVTGELTLLVGGPEADITAVTPVLQHLGTRIARCGDRVGDGQAVKLVNQLLCSVHLAAAAEALNFAARLDLDPATVLEIVDSGAASSFMLHDRGPRMLASDEPAVLSAVDIFVKDSSLVAAAADANGVDVPVLAAAAAKFAEASAAGFGRADDSAVIRAYPALVDTR